MAEGRCRSCPAPVLWVTIGESGKTHPAEVTESKPAPRRLLVHHPSLRATVISAAMMLSGQVDELLERGDVTSHESHFANCPAAAQHRRSSSS